MTLTRHPATYTDVLLPVFANMLAGCRRVLDPFGGTGKIFRLLDLLPHLQIEALEIEPEWAAHDSRITVGNALALPWPNGHFDAICTSPTYGNRMADHHEAKDASRRNTYRHAIGRPLHECNSGAMQWGPAYRGLHVAAWEEARRVLVDDGLFVLNIKDHIRSGQRVRVTDWHVETLIKIGFTEVRRQEVDCPGQRFGQNGAARIDYESVILFQKADEP